jgi:hypothetical protein
MSEEKPRERGESELADLTEKVSSNMVLEDAGLKIALALGKDSENGGPTQYYGCPALSIKGRDAGTGDPQEVDVMIEGYHGLEELVSSVLRLVLDEEGLERIARAITNETMRIHHSGGAPEIWTHAITERIEQEEFNIHPDLTAIKENE